MKEKQQYDGLEIVGYSNPEVTGEKLIGQCVCGWLIPSDMKFATPDKSSKAARIIAEMIVSIQCPQCNEWLTQGEVTTYKGVD